MEILYIYKNKQMKITNEIFGSKFLNLQKLTHKELPFKISKILLNSIEELRKWQSSFEQTRLELVKRLALKNEKWEFIMKKWLYQFSKENEEVFRNEHDSLLKEEQEYNIELLELPEDFKIASSDLLILKDIVIKL